jgi:hypothetical protein
MSPNELHHYLILYTTAMGNVGSFEVEAATIDEAIKEPGSPTEDSAWPVAALEIHPDDLSAQERGDFARMKLHILA